MTQLNPYIRFNDKKCREAMAFYKDCFGGEVTFQTVGETPIAKDMPADKQDLVMHATLKSGPIEFFGADMMRDTAKIGDNIPLALNCSSEKELRDIFAKLSAGGDVFMPVDKVFWGGIFGVVTDKYGVEWMLNYQEAPMK